jgi:outer membrane protein insertion porin family
LAAGFDLFHKEIDQTSESGFRSRRTGAGVRLGFPLAENLWMQTRYNLSRDEIYDIATNASAAINEAEGLTWTSLVGTSITYDLRDHPKNPTKGMFFQLSNDFAGLGGDVQYARVQAEVRGYYPITENILFVSRAIGGHIAGWGGEDVRLLDLFFKGGETVRGFERAGFGPRDLLTNDALGGRTYWATTAEVRFPIPLIPDDLGVQGAVFADAGSLFAAGNTSKDLAALGEVALADSAAIRASVGASILWASPVGPIRMDIAKVLSKESYDEEQFFRFGAMTNF